MCVEIKEIEKDRTYTLNGKEVYRNMESAWECHDDLTCAERKAFTEHLHEAHTTIKKPKAPVTKGNHTPGPWEYCTSQLDPKKHAFAILDNKEKSLIADVYIKSKFFGWGNKKNGRDPETTEANAKILAASPELFESLTEVVEWCIKNTSQYPPALAKAKGLLERLS